MTHTLVATGVSKVISSVTLLSPVDVTAEPDRCVALRGVNGSGKTTLLRLLAGLTPPTTGTITLDGRPVDERDPTVRAATAALIGAPAIYRDLTLRDHLTERFPHELSSGQTQLFRLACVWFRPSTVLLLDEPEQRLDQDKRRLIADLITERRADAATIVLACHDPDVIAAVADTVIDLQPADPT